MAIELVRIDDRLVHGQVVVGWVPHLHATEIVVVSEPAAKDPTQIALMRLALPEGVLLRVLGFKDAARYLAGEEARAQRILVLAPGPLEVLGLLDQGAAFESVNVGGLHYTAGRIQVGRAIFLSDLDRAALREIAARGVRLEGRAIPSERALDILRFIGQEVR